MTIHSTGVIIEIRERTAYAGDGARRHRFIGGHHAIAWAASCLLLLASSLAPQIASAQQGRPTVTMTNNRGSLDLQSSRLNDLLFGEPTRRRKTPHHAGDSEGPIIREGPAGLKGFLWDFGRANDTDHNQKPDGWGRREGRGYPAYVDIRLAARDEELQTALAKLDAWLLRQDSYLKLWSLTRRYVPLMLLLQPPAVDLPTMVNRMATHPVLPPLPPTLPDFVVDNFLRIRLDGGLAETWSTAVPINRTYQYRFRCRVMTKDLHHDSAVAELVFLDKNDREIAVHAIDPVRGTTPWTTYQIDRIRPPTTALRMMVRCRVQGSGDGLQDIRGEIGFDDIELEQFPQLRIKTDRRRGIYWQDQQVQVTARVMGLSRQRFDVRFRLLDYRNRELATHVVKIVDGKPLLGHQDYGAKRSSTRSPGKAKTPVNVSGQSDDILIDWTPPRLPPGFYRIAASLEEGSLSSLASVTSIAVIDRLVESAPHGPYGWTLSDIVGQSIEAQDWSPDELTEWLQALGVAWVKIPCWLAPDDLAGADKLSLLMRKLEDVGINSVGLLDVPPKSELPLYDLRGEKDEVAALLFRDEMVWRSRLEPIMTRLTLKCRTWQLGADRDHSFLGRPGLRESINNVSNGLQGFGQPIDLALSWPWMEPELPADEVSWQANCRSAEPPLGSEELEQYLSLERQRSGPNTWLLLDPIDAQSYQPEDRIRDMVLRMATVRRHRVQSSFVSAPKDPRHGVLQPDGRPDELLLPWRTTARLLGNQRFMGKLELRSGAKSLVFGGKNSAVMLVWANQPVKERMFLGENVRQVDVWGKSTPMPIDNSSEHAVHEINISRTPTFIAGIDPTLIAFRMSVQMHPGQIDSLLGEEQAVQVSFSNPTEVNLLGTIDFHTPRSWRVDTPSRPWEMLSRRQSVQRFRLVLGNNATVGTYEIPLVFQFQTTPPQTITVFRDLKIGPEGLELKADTKMIGRDMFVRLEVTNSGARTLTYQFILFPRNGRKDKRLIVSVKPGETIKRYIGLANGEELIGQTMWLRAIEQDADRVLNYTVLGQR